MNFLPTNTPDRNTTVLLWIIRGLLALLFLFAGGIKLVIPIEGMTKDTICRACSCDSLAWRKSSARLA